MKPNPRGVVAAVAVALLLMWGISPAMAQPLGTFRWQQQPYCNVIAVNVEQKGGVYHLDGVDDQCGAGSRASVVGLAFLNPSGSIGFGLTIVTSPGGTPLHVDATIDISTLSGSWRDSTGMTGPWTFVPGAGLGGTPRPVPRASFPSGLSAGGTTVTNVGTPVNATDAATKGYVDGEAASGRAYTDAGDAASRALARTLRAAPVRLTAYGGHRTGNVTTSFFGCVHLDTAALSEVRLDLQLPNGAVVTAVRFTYRDNSAASSLTLDMRRVNVSPNGAGDGSSGIMSSIDATFRSDVLTFASPLPPASEDTIYYVHASAPAHVGLLAFCGAQAIYTLP